MLLDAGADPNDSQALYNRMFEPSNEHLELLFEYGLGPGRRRQLARARCRTIFGPPAELLRYQLRWAVDHNFLDRVRLLVQNGVDFRSAYEDGRTPVELAQLVGHAEVVQFLVSQGATPPALDPAGALIAAIFAADRAAVTQLTTEHPGLLDELRQARPGLIVWATANDRTDVVTHLLELGFDVNALGRGDTPSETPWQTPLHEAASRGNLELAGFLLSAGADPNIRDARFGGTPLDWARHVGHRQEMVDFLEPLTDDRRPTKEADRADADD